MLRKSFVALLTLTLVAALLLPVTSASAQDDEIELARIIHKGWGRS